MSSSSCSRRRFLRGTVTAAMAAPFVAVLTLRRAHAADLTPVPLDNPTVLALAYTEDASEAAELSNYREGSLCANCQFFGTLEANGRGPCSLFPGFSVQANGWCSAWAAKP